MASKTERPRLALFAALVLAALVLSACMGRKPILQYAGCGQMPPADRLCIDTLPRNATDAEIARCYAQTTWQLLGENAQLRAQYTPCAR